MNEDLMLPLPGLPALPSLEPSRVYVPNAPALGGFYSNRAVLPQPKEQNPYLDPTRVQSISDALFNQAAIGATLEGTGLEGNVILGPLYMLRQYLMDTYLDTPKGESVILNTINSIGRDFDVFSGANLLKSQILGEPGLDSLSKAMGIGEEGIKHYDWDTGNIVSDVVMEVLTDPIALITGGTWGVAKSLGRKAARNTSLLDHVSKAEANRFVRDVSSMITNGASTNRIRRYIDSFVDVHPSIQVDGPLAAKHIMNDILKSGEYRILNTLEPLRNTVRGIDQSVINISINATPLGLARYGWKYLIKPSFQAASRLATQRVALLRNVPKESHNRVAAQLKATIVDDVTTRSQILETDFETFYREIGMNHQQLTDLYLEVVSNLHRRHAGELITDAQIEQAFLAHLRKSTGVSSFRSSLIRDIEIRRIRQKTAPETIPVNVRPTIPEEEMMRPLLDHLNEVRKLLELADDTITAARTYSEGNPFVDLFLDRSTDQKRFRDVFEALTEHEAIQGRTPYKALEDAPSYHEFEAYMHLIGYNNNEVRALLDTLDQRNSPLFMSTEDLRFQITDNEEIIREAAEAGITSKEYIEINMPYLQRLTKLTLEQENELLNKIITPRVHPDPNALVRDQIFLEQETAKLKLNTFMKSYMESFNSYKRSIGYVEDATTVTGNKVFDDATIKLYEEYGGVITTTSRKLIQEASKVEWVVLHNSLDSLDSFLKSTDAFGGPAGLKRADIHNNILEVKGFLDDIINTAPEDVEDFLKNMGHLQLNRISESFDELYENTRMMVRQLDELEKQGADLLPWEFRESVSTSFNIVADIIDSRLAQDLGEVADYTQALYVKQLSKRKNLDIVLGFIGSDSSDTLTSLMASVGVPTGSFRRTIDIVIDLAERSGFTHVANTLRSSKKSIIGLNNYSVLNSRLDDSFKYIKNTDLEQIIKAAIKDTIISSTWTRMGADYILTGPELARIESKIIKDISDSNAFKIYLSEDLSRTPLQRGSVLDEIEVLTAQESQILNDQAINNRKMKSITESKLPGSLDEFRDIVEFEVPQEFLRIDIELEAALVETRRRKKELVISLRGNTTEQIRADVSSIVRNYLRKQAEDDLTMFQSIDGRALSNLRYLNESADDVRDIIFNSRVEDPAELYRIYLDFLNKATGYVKTTDNSITHFTRIADDVTSTMNGSTNVDSAQATEYLQSQSKNFDVNLASTVAWAYTQIKEVNKHLRHDTGLVNRSVLPEGRGLYFYQLEQDSFAYKKVYEPEVDSSLLSRDAFTEWDDGMYIDNIMSLNKIIKNFNEYYSQDFNPFIYANSKRTLMRLEADSSLHKYAGYPPNSHISYREYVQNLPPDKAYAYYRLVKQNNVLPLTPGVFEENMVRYLEIFKDKDFFARVKRDPYNTNAKIHAFRYVLTDLATNDKLLRIMTRNNEVLYDIFKKQEPLTEVEYATLLDIFKVDDKHVRYALLNMEEEVTPKEYFIKLMVNNLSDEEVIAIKWAAREDADLSLLIKRYYDANPIDPERKIIELEELTDGTSYIDDILDPASTNTPEGLDRFLYLGQNMQAHMHVRNIMHNRITDDFHKMYIPADDFAGRFSEAITLTIKQAVESLKILLPLNDLRRLAIDKHLDLKRLGRDVFLANTQRVLSLNPKDLADYVRVWGRGYYRINNTSRQLDYVLDIPELEKHGIRVVTKGDETILFNTLDVDWNNTKPIQFDYHGEGLSHINEEYRKVVGDINDKLIAYADLDTTPFERELFVPIVKDHDAHKRMLDEWITDDLKGVVKLDEEMWNNNSVKIDFANGGTINDSFGYGNIYTEDITNILQTNWTSIIKRADASAKYLQLFDNNNFLLTSSVYGNMFDGMTDKQLSTWFTENNFKVVVLGTQTRKGLIKPKVSEYPISSRADLDKAKELGAITVPSEVYSMMYRSVNNYQIDVKLLDWFNRTVIAAYKSSFLMTTGFLVRNGFDMLFKNLNDGGTLVNAPEIIHDVKVARDMLQFHERVQREMIETFGGASRVALKKTLAQYPEDMRRVYMMVEYFITSPASSGLAKSMEELIKGYNLRAETSGAEKAVRWFSDNVVYNPVSRVVNNAMNSTEQMFRLGAALSEARRTGMLSQGINRSIAAHFDYNTKRPLEVYSELFIPFVTFPLRNLAYYADSLMNNPTLFKMLLDTQQSAWDPAESDSAINAYQTKSDWLQSQAEQGTARFGDTILRLNPSAFDALNLIINPLGEVSQRTSPILKSITNADNPDYDHITNLTPFMYNITRLTGNPITGKEGTFGRMSREGLTPGTLVPSLFSDIRRFPRRQYAARPRTRFLTPTRYPTQKEMRRHYSSSRQGVFNRIYRKNYPKGNLSRVYLNTLPNNPAYHADPRHIVSAVGRIKWMFR